MHARKTTPTSGIESYAGEALITIDVREDFPWK